MESRPLWRVRDASKRLHYEIAFQSIAVRIRLLVLVFPASATVRRTHDGRHCVSYGVIGN